MEMYLPRIDSAFGVKNRLVKAVEDEFDNNGSVLPVKYVNRCRWIWDVDGTDMEFLKDADAY